MRPIEDFRKLQAELLARSMRIPPEWAGRLIQEIIYERLEDRFRQIRPFPNLLETLADLKAMGFKLAILSDFPVRRKLQYLGLDGVWDLAACSEETHYLKPNPEPFLAVAGRLSIPPGEILFVGDKYHYDILGAHRVGMRTAHLTRNPHGRSVADLSFRTYRDFSSRVQQIGAVTDSPNPSH
jgi:putative hydrolase of the HAD superfamily